MDHHYYPPHIAAALLSRWPATAAAALPSPALLTQLVSVAYQASLMREEERSVHCFLLYCPESSLMSSPAASDEPLVMSFVPARPCNEQQLRRLSPTVHRGNAVLTIHSPQQDELQIWGMMLLGPAWEQATGSRGRAPVSVPAHLLVQVRGPGSLVFYCGRTRILTLEQGRIEGHGFLEFPSAWARGHYEVEGPPPLPAAQPASSTAQPLTVDELTGSLALHILRRCITRVRNARHGGMIVLVPDEAVAHLSGPNGLLRPKYRVQPHGQHAYYRRLQDTIVERVTELAPGSWDSYQQLLDAELSSLDQHVDWFADLLADLTAVDGALVLTKSLDLVGFGVEIHAPLVALGCVYRALDVEATQVEAEAVDSGGTRHRAAYRLCAADAQCLAIVVSQDGAVKFVRQREEKVIFWDQLAL